MRISCTYIFQMKDHCQKIIVHGYLSHWLIIAQSINHKTPSDDLLSLVFAFPIQLCQQPAQNDPKPGGPCGICHNTTVANPTLIAINIFINTTLSSQGFLCNATSKFLMTWFKCTFSTKFHSMQGVEQIIHSKFDSCSNKLPVLKMADFYPVNAELLVLIHFI